MYSLHIKKQAFELCFGILIPLKLEYGIIQFCLFIYSFIKHLVSTIGLQNPAERPHKGDVPEL